MRKLTTTRILRLSVLVLFGLIVVNTQAQQRPLLTPTTQEGSVRPPSDPTVTRSQNVIVDVQQLRAPEKRSITLPLFDGTRLTLIREQQKRVGKNGLIWSGKIAGEPGSSVILSVGRESVIGNVVTQRGRFYQIRYLGNGVHSLRQIDQSKFPNEAEPLKPDIKPGGMVAADTCNTDPPSDIDIMVVYTDDTRVAAGGADAMETTIYLAVEETNQSYLNSNVTQRIRLVHIEEVNYNETGNLGTLLTELQNGGDGVLDNVPTLRNTHAADHVVAIAEVGGNNCGIGYMMTTVSNAFEAYAYTVVARNCATGYYSFAHELGHNMGADHNCTNASSTGPYTYNRGWVNNSANQAQNWRTIMAYNVGGATRVMYWSNPGVNYPVGLAPMGGSCPTPPYTADNHQVLNNTALTVANFRCSSPGVNNVWMKDTWNDTGAEPDPLTASDDMWKSPYIWVRNQQDTNLTHQHQHENPIVSQTNWVYVKLHNGFNNSTSGTLELWYADASTNLTWQGGWTQAASIPVNSFAAHSTKVVEAQWTPPATGHYCMIARWVSGSDPMTTPETGDINANTRGNNNIVWRNLNIVTPDPAEDVSFIVRGAATGRGGTSVMSLVIRAPKNEMANSFIRYGRVVVHFDDALMRAWRQGGGRGKGFQATRRGFIITDRTGATFDNIVTSSKLLGRVRLTFTRLPTTPKRMFIIDAVQMGSRGRYNSLIGDSYVIGGVSYEIHTDRQ